MAAKGTALLTSILGNLKRVDNTKLQRSVEAIQELVKDWQQAYHNIESQLTLALRINEEQTRLLAQQRREIEQLRARVYTAEADETITPAVAAFDVQYALAQIEHARSLGLGARPRRRRSGVPAVPDILICTFDAERDSFHVVYADLTAQDLARAELADVGERQVVAWEVDEFHRGVEVVLGDGSITSFSAEFPLYLHDEDYRRRVDARRRLTGAE